MNDKRLCDFLQSITKLQIIPVGKNQKAKLVVIYYTFPHLWVFQINGDFFFTLK